MEILLPVALALLLAPGLALVAIPERTLSRWADALEASVEELEASDRSWAAFAVRCEAASPRSPAGPRSPAVANTHAPPEFRLSLLVRVDERTGRLSPSIQLRGRGRLSEPWVRLELIDGEERLRHAVRRRLPPSAVGTEFALPAFEPPDGVATKVALDWHWDLVIEDREGKRAHWREHPRPAGGLNAEAELELAGCPRGPRGPKWDGRWYWIHQHHPWAPGGEFEIHCRECAYSMWVTPHAPVRENFPPPECCPRCGHDGR